MVEVDIFNPQTSVVARDLDGKVIFCYGNNGTGKSLNASKAPKCFFLACESGLNGLSGVKYNRIGNWVDFKKVVRQFTDKKTVDKAKEMYQTIVIDEVYASSIFCQDFICQRLGISSFGENENSKVNAWQEYEKEYWREINKLVNSGFTVIFIGHAEEKDGYTRPKGDKRCLNPIIDNCDIVVYLKGNGTDENGKEILSTGYFIGTNEFFARSRYTKMVPYIHPYSMDGMIKAINDAIDAEVEESGVEAVSFEEQKAQNTNIRKSYEELMQEVADIGLKYIMTVEPNFGSPDQPVEERKEEKGRKALQKISDKVLGLGKDIRAMEPGQEQIIEAWIMAVEDAIAALEG